MSDIKCSQPLPMRLSKLMAEMFYFMAQEMLDKLGEEEGKKAIKAATDKMAKSRVEAMKRDALEAGLPPVGKDTYSKIKDFGTPDWKRDENGVVSYCPMAETWEQYGEEGLAVGALYCQIDYALYEGFGMKLDRPKCLTNGDTCCVFNYTMLDRDKG